MNDEEALIRSFVVATKQERYIGFLANPKRRGKATAALLHFGDLDPRWVVPLPAGKQAAEEIEAALRSRGAGDTCHVISYGEEIDGRQMALAEALGAVANGCEGTLLSCLPGKLAYFAGEAPHNRCILVRP